MNSLLLDCPSDIISLVLELLPSPDLYTACLVCSGLRSLAEPFLYAKIEWIWVRTGHSLTKPVEYYFSVPPIILFLRTILCRPQLAEFVTTLVLEGDGFFTSWLQANFNGNNPKIPTAESCDLEGLISLIKAMNVSFESLWIEELRKGTMDAYVALCMSQLSNIKRIQISPNFASECQLVYMMLKLAICGPPFEHLPPFSSLRDVSMVIADQEIYNGFPMRAAETTANALPLLYLPSLEKLQCLIQNPNDPIQWPAMYPPDPLKLTSLHLTMIREGQLGRILSVARNLKALHWEWYYQPNIRNRYMTNTINLDMIAADLWHVRNTLTDLKITAETVKQMGDIELDPLYMVGSFKRLAKFGELRTLEIPLPFLTQSLSVLSSSALKDPLPLGLEYLTITDDLWLQEEYEWEEHAPLDAIRPWLASWKNSTPQLKQFHLLVRLIDFDTWESEMRQELRDLGFRVGVGIKITKLHRDFKKSTRR